MRVCSFHAPALPFLFLSYDAHHILKCFSFLQTGQLIFSQFSAVLEVDAYNLAVVRVLFIFTLEVFDSYSLCQTEMGDSWPGNCNLLLRVAAPLSKLRLCYRCTPDMQI